MNYTEKEAAQTFNQIYDQSTDLIYIYDENGIILDVNNTITAVYGYSKEELIGKSTEFISAQSMNDLESVPALIDRIWNKGETVSLEWWAKRKDGTVFLKEVRAKKGEYFGRPVIIATARDITERKRQEEEIEIKTEQLKKLNKELDSFMWKVSHDLKSPLSSIRGIVNMAMIEKDPTNLRTYFDHIGRSIEKLNIFISEMEDMARNKQSEVNYSSIDFNQLLDGVIEDFRFTDSTQGVKVSKKVDQRDDFGTDSLLLHSVLHNIMSNSYKYCSRDHPNIEINVTSDNREGVIEVEDNGIGIDEESLPKVFEMFYRATERSTGSGLGLFIVKEAIQKMNGHVSVQSTKGRGTKITVRIPNSIAEIHG